MSNSRAFGAASLMMVLASVGAVGWVSYKFVPRDFSKQQAKPSQASPLLNADACTGVLGLDPDTLAAAGLNSENARSVLKDLQEHIAANGEALSASILAHNAAKKQVDTDQRLIRAGRPPADEMLVQHNNTLAAAAADRATRQAAAMDAACARLSDEQKANLAMLKSNAGRDVPPAYCLVQRDDAQWVALRNALAAEKQAAEHGGKSQDASRTFLATVRAEQKTSHALQNTAINGTAIRHLVR